MNCYQWPIPSVTTSFVDKILCFNELYPKIELIEEYFEKCFSQKVVLLPSGRACISAILKINNISRGDVVWAPRWSSHCIWNNISYFATPTINLNDSPDVYLNVHKWGYVHTLNNDYKTEGSIIIEDSVDSLITNSNSLYPNGGHYEIFSLSKTIGSYSGGLLLCKNKRDYDAIKELQSYDIKLGLEQSYLKYLNCTKPDAIDVNNNWHYREFENFSMDWNSLENIEKCLVNYNINVATCKSRLKILQEIGVFYLEQDSRLPTQAVLKGEDHDTCSDYVMIRKMNSSRTYGNDEMYENYILVPLHFGVDQYMFDKIVENIIN